eukprot:TRINITY_DN55048_c0_g1_i1.p1 TRINITY_DN55048_c0_g1~~TRINITY_DN55048_c0_g1_i1.p1  ORF type:complete len:314 (+),score=121.58 TRINITY_DN55048_c0_g1_i1:80-943(+)
MAGHGSVKLYYDDGRTVDYELRSVMYKLLPDGIAVATFNDPKTLNALTENLMGETFCILEHAKRDPAVKVLVWTGEGKCWCSGAALKGGTSTHIPRDIQKQYAKRGLWRSPRDLVLKSQTLAFWDFPKPAIAAVQGMCVGGAVNMALCNYFDFVVCSEQAKFKYPFVKLGLTPELGSSAVLPFLIGYARAKELFFLGDWASVADVQRFGLVNRVVPHDQLMETALGLARRLAGEPNQAALRLGKRIVNCHQRRDMERVLDDENTTIWEAVRSAKGGVLMASKTKGKL